MSEELIFRKLIKSEMSPIPEDAVPAMAYVPFQQFGEVYEELKAFECGTLFPVLNKPFLGRRGDLK